VGSGIVTGVPVATGLPVVGSGIGMERPVGIGRPGSGIGTPVLVGSGRTGPIGIGTPSRGPAGFSGPKGFGGMTPAGTGRVVTTLGLSVAKRAAMTSPAGLPIRCWPMTSTRRSLTAVFGRS
jgi:hypothetical protein